MRTCFEIFAVRMALSKGRLSRSDKLDSFLCSHILPAALNGALAGLQALMAPYMPHVMAQVRRPERFASAQAAGLDVHATLHTRRTGAAAPPRSHHRRTAARRPSSGCASCCCPPSPCG